MSVLQERRTGNDRREFALYYRYGSEQRDNTEQRRSESSENELADPDQRDGGYYRDPSGKIPLVE